MADHRADPEHVISPKVIAQLGVSLGLTVVIAMIGAITPDMLTALGSWGIVLYAGIVALGGALAGYAVRDPLRQPLQQPDDLR